MNDTTLQTGRAAVVNQAVAAFADACAAARAWGEGPAGALPDILGGAHRTEIEALRDAALHQAAVEEWAAATARMLIERCLEIAERGTRVVERCDWEEDDNGMPYIAHRSRESIVGATAEAAIRAATALRTVAEAIERSLDIDAAITRYRVFDR